MQRMDGLSTADASSELPAFVTDTDPVPRRSGGRDRRRIAVALQGGGSHGAFTWGVLDRLLQEPSFEFVGISGTSAGAMNAAIMADGLRQGGPEAARSALGRYWEDVGRLPGFASLAPPSAFGAPTWHLDNNPLFLWFDLLTRIWSPYQTNPCSYNPLRDLLQRIDFAGIREDTESARLFICATNVKTGLRRVFDNSELSIDVLLASACLPQLYQAVEIGGEFYWDGGYTGNPALAPLYLRTDATDVIVVGINPLMRADLPRTARDIINRVDEISFNSAFMLELGAIAFTEQLLKSGGGTKGFMPPFVHGIGDKILSSFGASSKLNHDRGFLRHLHEIGWNAADRWLVHHLDDVGLRSSVDLSKLLPMKLDFSAQRPSGAPSTSSPQH
jgi:NTE family protein